MDNQPNDENQAAGIQDYSELILEKNIGDMEVFNRQAESENPAVGELSFLVSLYELLCRRLKDLQSNKRDESQPTSCLQSQVFTSNQERDEVIQKSKIDSMKLVQAMRKADLFYEQIVNLSMLLKESQKALLMEKAEHCRVNKALETKIKSLEEKAGKDLDLKELQDEHQRELDTLKRTNESLLEELNKTTHSSLEEQWQKKYADLEKTHETTLSNTMLLIEKDNQESLEILEDKLKAQLKRNDNLEGELRVSYRDWAESQKEIEELRDHIIDSRVAAIAELKVIKDECTLLENICFELMRKSKGPFGKKMQDREVDLEKMKMRMRTRETHGVTVTQARTRIQTDTETQTHTETETDTESETESEVDTEMPAGATCSVSLKRMNDSLLEELHNNKKAQRSLDAQWQKKYAELEKTHEVKLSNTILLIKKKNQESQKILNDKLKAQLKRNGSLLEKLGLSNRQCERLRDTQDNIRDSINEARVAMAEERTLLEDICLELKKKCRGLFGRRMQDREFEIEKMKMKMRETQAAMMLRQTRRRTQMETEVETEVSGGPTCNSDGPRRPAAYPLRLRKPHLYN